MDLASNTAPLASTRPCSGITTIRRAELTASGTKLTRVNDQAVRRALEVAGVEFIDENAGGPGVRLRERQQQKTWVLKITLSSAQFRVTVRI
jgi:hypothetical protein